MSSHPYKTILHCPLWAAALVTAVGEHLPQHEEFEILEAYPVSRPGGAKASEVLEVVMLQAEASVSDPEVALELARVPHDAEVRSSATGDLIARSRVRVGREGEIEQVLVLAETALESLARVLAAAREGEAQLAQALAGVGYDQRMLSEESIVDLAERGALEPPGDLGQWCFDYVLQSVRSGCFPDEDAFERELGARRRAQTLEACAPVRRSDTERGPCL